MRMSGTLLLGCGRSALSAEGQRAGRAEQADRGSREITCGCCCWPGSPRDSRKRRTKRRLGQVLESEWGGNGLKGQGQDVWALSADLKSVTYPHLHPSVSHLEADS